MGVLEAATAIAPAHRLHVGSPTRFVRATYFPRCDGIRHKRGLPAQARTLFGFSQKSLEPAMHAKEGRYDLYSYPVSSDSRWRWHRLAIVLQGAWWVHT